MTSTSRPIGRARRALLRARFAGLVLAAAPAYAATPQGRDYTTWRGLERDRPAAAPIPATWPEAPEWDERAVEHLLNRAAFGASPEEVRRWAGASPEELVEHLLDPPPPRDPFFFEPPAMPRRELARMDAMERRQLLRRLRFLEQQELKDFVAWWIDEMASGKGALRERMTLFWHGFFTTSSAKVKRTDPLIRQNELLREHALGSYADLLRGILRDPAMLLYLDNDANRRGAPNENLAREVLELFSLGEGNYSEEDVREAARALTGRGVDRRRAYEFSRSEHDSGYKTILGERGRFGGDELARVLLRQEACARHVALRLITWFEGVEPEEARLADYAAFLAQEGFELRPFLRRLLLDPAFYRDEVRGARVQGPVEWLVGLSRRLELELPPELVFGAARMLGQELLAPPSVAGWEEGPAWITTSSLMMRGNVAGALLGVLGAGEDLHAAGPARDADPLAEDELARVEAELEELASEDEEGGEEGELGSMAGMDAGAGESSAADPLRRIARLFEGSDWRPRLHLAARMRQAGIEGDRELVRHLCETLLAIAPPPETLRMLEQHLAAERARAGIDGGALLDARGEAERILRRLAHLILSLPEAQLG